MEDRVGGGAVLADGATHRDRSKWGLPVLRERTADSVTPKLGIRTCGGLLTTRHFWNMVLLGLLESMAIGDHMELGPCGENTDGSERRGPSLLGRHLVLRVDRWSLGGGKGLTGKIRGWRNQVGFAVWMVEGTPDWVGGADPFHSHGGESTSFPEPRH